ncbi:MAG: hypothetical protein IJW54_04240 [Clostridia bacterium]|nr:hypothetical protein [Clostridia bacterium]
MNIFERYKGKALVLVIIKALLIGIGVGSLVGGALLLLIKHEVILTSPMLSLLFGFLSFGLSFLIVFLSLKGNDKMLAKRLDKQFDLKEKMQTMLTHRNSEGAIYELQRQDANDSLEKIKNKSFDLKRIWIYILSAVLGLAVLILALVINPVKPEPEPEPEIPFKLSELQEAALVELLDYIDKSSMIEASKEIIKASVNDLITGLKLSTTAKEKNMYMEQALDEIYEETDNSSLALELMSEVWAQNTDEARALAIMLNYYDWPLYDEWDKYVDSVAKLRNEFVFDGGEEGDVVSEEDKISFMVNKLSDLSSKLLTAITKSKISENDELTIALKRFAEANEVNEELGTKVLGLSALAKQVEVLGYTEAQRALDDTILALNSIIYKALSDHKVNTDTGEYAMTRICELFNYPIPQFERPRFIKTSVGEGGGEEPEGSGGGGIGAGPTFGSDDLVYDPNTGEYVEYGEILNRYYTLMYGKTEAGVYTEEEKLALEKYFAILQDGFPEENEEIQGEDTNE